MTLSEGEWNNEIFGRVFDSVDADGSGFLEREEVEAFAADLSYARFTVAKSFAIFPGSTVLLQLGLFIRLDGMGQALDYLDQTLDVLLPAYLGIER